MAPRLPDRPQVADSSAPVALAVGGTSRREFIKRIIASGAVASSVSFMAGGLAGCSTPRPAVAGGVERLLTLNVNGQARRVDVLPQETLAMTLRYKLGLTGTKLACDRAECGACTVMIDGVSHYSCSTLTHSVRARKVVTIEGVRGPDGELHPVQRAFVEELSPQCGFCTPGQVMAAVALLQKNPRPSREQARHAMSGNLCRCGAYDNYLNGVMRACGNLQEIQRGAVLGAAAPVAADAGSASSGDGHGA
jgi:aerobic-type carbon monoxide dehydrogenase small subunit (CoxS/CutS family)